MNFTSTLPQNIKKNESIVLPISMNQPLERGNRLEAILDALDSSGYKNQVTILICDHLNRYNCNNEAEALKLGDQFIEDHKMYLDGYTVVRWKAFLDAIHRQYFDEQLNKIKNKSNHGSRFYNKMKKTWEKCLSENQSLENSILYQIEEYAAILCMNEFDHLFYPKKITNGMAYLYGFIEGKKPTYHHIKVSENKMNSSSNMMPNEAFFIGNTSVVKDNRNHVHIAFRALLEQMDVLLGSAELSVKSKKVFTEEAEILLMKHGILCESYNESSQ